MKKTFLLLFLSSLTVCLLSSSILASVQNNNASHVPQAKLNSDIPLKAAWEPWFPYDYLKIKSIQSSLTGLDVELLHQFAAEANHHLVFQSLSWNETLQALKQGKIDLATGATYSKERAQYVYYSKPYRFEEDSLFVLRAKAKNYHFKTVEAFIAYVQNNHLRIGIKKNTVLADSKLNNFVLDASQAKYLVTSGSDAENLKLLLSHQIDGFIADRIAGSSLIWQARAVDQVVERYLHMKTGIHLIFSKKTVPEQTVEEFNSAIDTISHQAVYRNDFSWYIYPLIMIQATGAKWFKTLDILGTIFYSISGVLIAYALKKTLLSALVYAALPSMTGGILRDVIFSNRPVEALESPQYLLLVCAVVLTGYLLISGFNLIMQYEYVRNKSNFLTRAISKIEKYFKQLLTICDALGLATLAVAGVMISLMARAEPLWLWGPFFAFLTASFGTIVRDILSKQERLEDVVGELNSEVAIVWGLFLSLALTFNANNIQPQVVQYLILTTVAGSFITRLLIHYFKVPNVYFR